MNLLTERPIAKDGDSAASIELFACNLGNLPSENGTIIAVGESHPAINFLSFAYSLRRASENGSRVHPNVQTSLFSSPLDRLLDWATLIFTWRNSFPSRRSPSPSPFNLRGQREEEME